ncbi:MAG: tetratricopeptide repeat protein [Siculibacillus sp.]|nr:tetratricopeptide repeat protein [Siculibacillus sp.]
MIGSGVDAASRGVDGLWAWAESTVSGAPSGWSAAPAPVAKPAPAAPPVAATSSAAKPAPAPVAAPAPVSAPAAAPAAPDPLALARSAHARGDVTAALRAYEDLIAKRPTDAAVRGELGNVYWAAGRLQDAARSYHGAALVLLAAGRRDEAARIEQAIRKGDAALADDLARRLAEAAGTKK